MTDALAAHARGEAKWTCSGAELGAVRVAVDPLEVLDARDVVPRLRELDRLALRPPVVDVLLASVVRGEGRPLVAVLLDQVPQVPRSVADVELRVRQVGDAERRSARVHRDPLRRARQEL